MRKLSLLLLSVAAATFSFAQVLPKPSPTSELEQAVGATDIELEYSRPSVKDRKVFGELVPYEKLWRFGANSSTTIKTNHSLFFDGKELKAGTYSVFAIPNKDSWEIIFNTDKSASTDEYAEKNDALRVKAKAVENSFTESFTLNFDKLRDESASLVVLWEKLKVEIPFTVNTKENAAKNIADAIEKSDIGKVYNNAANYYYGTLKDYKKALEFVEKSMTMKETYGNTFLKARVIYELGKKDEAVKLANKALEIAKADKATGYVNFIEGTLTKWAK